MQLRARLKRPPHQQDDLPHRQLRHRPAIRMRIVKHRNSALARRRAIDLVDANAKRSHRNQFRSRIQYRRRNPSLRPDAKNRGPAHLLNQLAFVERSFKRLDREPRLFKLRSRHPADILQQ